MMMFLILFSARLALILLIPVYMGSAYNHAVHQEVLQFCNYIALLIFCTASVTYSFKD
jgi:hypothetical protein